MLDRALVDMRNVANIVNVDRIGLIILILAGFITYGAKFISVSVFKIGSDRMFKTIVTIKMIGLLLGIVGFLRITQII